VNCGNHNQVCSLLSKFDVSKDDVYLFLVCLSNPAGQLQCIFGLSVSVANSGTSWAVFCDFVPDKKVRVMKYNCLLRLINDKGQRCLFTNCMAALRVNMRSYLMVHMRAHFPAIRA